MDSKDAAGQIYANYKKVLKNAKDGEVVTRFPPEPSGFLHVGHVKAAMLNYHYAKIYKGKMILRFDDTNPQAEKEEFVENIKRDLKTLDITPDQVTHTSDHFDKLIELMKKLITDGNAYADCSTGDEMHDQREKGEESQYRLNNTVDKNLKIFGQMVAGNKKDWGDKNWCIRAKMSMQDKHKCLRDPVFFRMSMDVPHHRTGKKYSAYPTYDFACPVVDSIENVTHALRSAEYSDRANGYGWVQEKLGLRKVAVQEFSRLNFLNTCLSKRKLKWIIEQGYVEGWEDPRFPTVQGIMRRGMTVLALTKFMLENGASKRTVNMEWDKIWATNKDVIDPVVPRYSAIVEKSLVKLTNGPEQNKFETHPLHPKNNALGNKTVEYAKEVYIENADAQEIAVDEKVTLMKWGNIKVTGKDEKDGVVTLTAQLLPDDKDFKKTKKITWIAKSDTNFEVTIQELHHIITKEKIEENDKIEDIVNKNSSIETLALGEGNMRTLKKGDKIQLERRGYFIIDNVQIPGDQGKNMKLIFIPDGKQSSMSKNIKGAIDQGELTKKKEQKKGKGGAAAPEEEDGEKKLSKKELNKLKKKDNKAKAKGVAKEDGAGGKGADAAPSGGKAAKVVASTNVTFNTIPTELSEALGFCEKALAKKQFLHGDRLSSLDKQYYDKIQPHMAKLSPLTHPYSFAWFGFVSKFTDQVRASWPSVEAAPATSAGDQKGKQDKKKKEEEADDFDPFADDDDDADAEAAKKAAQEAKEKATKKKKKVVIAMSLVMLEVKPLDDKTNLDDLAKKIFKDIQQDGLFWKTEYKKEPVAFGIFKLIIAFSLEDEKVSVDGIVEKIEEMEDYVQSVEIAAFNKI